MGGRQCQGIHRLRHREQPLEALGWRHRQRELLKNASAGVVDQHHQQRRMVLCGVKPTIAVMQQSKITANQDQWPRRQRQSHRERQRAVEAGGTAKAEARP